MSAGRRTGGPQQPQERPTVESHRSAPTARRSAPVDHTPRARRPAVFRTPWPPATSPLAPGGTLRPPRACRRTRGPCWDQNAAVTSSGGQCRRRRRARDRGRSGRGRQVQGGAPRVDRLERRGRQAGAGPTSTGAGGHRPPRGRRTRIAYAVAGPQRPRGRRAPPPRRRPRRLRVLGSGRGRGGGGSGCNVSGGPAPRSTGPAGPERRRSRVPTGGGP